MARQAAETTDQENSGMAVHLVMAMVSELAISDPARLSRVRDVLLGTLQTFRRARKTVDIASVERAILSIDALLPND